MDKKYVKYIVVDKHILQIDEDAKKGDQLNLLDVTKIDTIFIEKEIETKKNELFNARLADFKKEWEKNKDTEIESIKTKLASEYDIKIENYRNIIENKDRDNKLLKERQDKDLELKVKEYEHKLNNKDSQLKSLESDLNNTHKIEVINMNSEIKELKNKLITFVDNKKTEIELAETKVRMNVEKEINDLSLEITRLKEEIDRKNREKSTQNIKDIGNDLENWCKAQYEAVAVAGFENCSFVKTNKEVEGEKPDFLFTAFAKGTNAPLVKVICEMKSESFVEGSKKNNADHYKKLHSDRINHGGPEAYALLVSELERNNANIIEKVPGYENMFMVRPAYFIPFLSIIYNLSTKYSEIVLANIEFETKTKILEDFEIMKRDIIDVTFKNLKIHADSISDKVGKIKSICAEIEDKHIEQINKNMNTINNKIQNFAIEKIIKKIEKN